MSFINHIKELHSTLISLLPNAPPYISVHPPYTSAPPPPTYTSVPPTYTSLNILHQLLPIKLSCCFSKVSLDHPICISVQHLKNTYQPLLMNLICHLSKMSLDHPICTTYNILSIKKLILTCCIYKTLHLLSTILLYLYLLFSIYVYIYNIDNQIILFV